MKIENILRNISIICLMIHSTIVLSITDLNIYGAEIDTIKFSRSIISNGSMNPGKGLYVNHWRNNNYNDVPDFINIIYQRFNWRDIETSEGNLDLSKINKFIENCKSQGYRAAFRVMSSSLGMGTITPEYVFTSGVPKVKHQLRDREFPYSRVQYDPVYWNKTYLEKYTIFVSELGKRLQGGKGIEFIDIGGIGIFGEMHLGLHIDGMWTEGELKQYEYTYDKYFSAYRDVIDAYVLAFPHTRVFLNISRYPQIASYAASKGVNLRFDGLHYYKNMVTKFKVSNSFIEHCSENSKYKVSCMYEFSLGEHPSEFIANASITKMHGEPVSYLHVNLGSAKTWSNEFKSTLSKYSELIGYNIIPLSMSIPSRFDINQTVKIDHRWVNSGMSAPESDLDLIIDIVDVDNNIVFKKINTLDVSSWSTNIEVSKSSLILLPVNLHDGDYTLRFGLVSRKYNRKPIELDISKNPVDGMYKLIDINVNNGVAIKVVI